jgi:hypothetical protein
VLRRWEVGYGPQFRESVDQCDVAPDRLELHLRAFRLGLERDPFMYSESFGEDARRVLETTDFAGGFVLTAYAVLYEDCKAKLMWVEAHPLPEATED